MDDSRLLQESYLAARQPRKGPHQVIQATMSEGLAQGPYVAARVGFEPVTFHTKDTEHLLAFPCSCILHVNDKCFIKYLIFCSFCNHLLILICYKCSHKNI